MTDNQLLDACARFEKTTGIAPNLLLLGSKEIYELKLKDIKLHTDNTGNYLGMKVVPVTLHTYIGVAYC